MKTYGGIEVQFHVFVTSALYGGLWSASSPGCFVPGENAPDIHWKWGFLGSRACLDAVPKTKAPCFCQESNPVHSARSLVTILAELSLLTIATIT
jgi:hypothetical protein